MSSSSQPDLTTFKALSFDCYGTLIDWETGLSKALLYLVSQLPPKHPLKADPPTALLRRFDDIGTALEASQPTLLYNENQVEAVTQLARELGIPLPDSVAEPFGNAPGTWAPFSDTIAGLEKLAKRYKLVILSNVDNKNIENTVEKQLAPVKFDAVYTAQDIGSYKPNHKNFEYLFAHAKKDLGIDKEKGELLHVACSLKADHVPAKELGLRSVWISRGKERNEGNVIGGDVDKFKDKVAYEWKFDTIGEFADEVERQFADKSQ